MEPKQEIAPLPPSASSKLPAESLSEIQIAQQRKQKKQRKTQPSQKTPILKQNALVDYRVTMENGLRWIQPYFFEYRAFAKERWLGRSLMDVFAAEFRDQPEHYYRAAIQDGRITVNGERVSADYRFQNSDQLCHRAHRHEAPVLAQPIRILARTETFVVVDKPGSVPVHSCGRFHFNSVVEILRKEHGLEKLYPVHRLDRLTSGVLLFALDPDTCREVGAKFMDRSIEKEYVCRVVGEFPEGEITVDQPLLTAHHSTSINMIHPDGKPSITIFERMHTNGKTSVVKCRPQTGRTHQIRIHLQWLGYPIANDPLYRNEQLWGSPAANNDKDVPLSIEEVKRRANAWSLQQLEKESQQARDNPDRYCSICKSSVSLPADPRQLSIWLHALTYRSEDMYFTTELPEWARQDFEEDAEMVWGWEHGR